MTMPTASTATDPNKRTFRECTKCTADEVKPHKEHDGQKIETIHGEKLTVMKTELLLVKKNKKPTGEVQLRVMAESGGIPTWFPIHYIK